MSGYCPVCAHAELAPKVRDGVAIDVCPSCRGIWLDRGELEKLIARARHELDDREPPSSRRPQLKHSPHRKRSLLESLGEIFD